MPLTPSLSPSAGERVAEGRVRGWPFIYRLSLGNGITPNTSIESLQGIFAATPVARSGFNTGNSLSKNSPLASIKVV